MRNIFSIIFFCFLAIPMVVAQPIKELPKAKKLKIAQELEAKKQIYNALEWYEKVYQMDKKDISVIQHVAELNLLERDFKQAERWFKRLVRADKDKNFPLSQFQYARVLKMNGKYEESVTEFQEFITNYTGDDLDRYKILCENEILGSQIAKEEGDKPKEEVIIENIGRGINSPFTEAAPISRTRDEVYYVSLPSDSVIVFEDEDDAKAASSFARLFVAKRSEEGWEDGKPVEGEINKPGFHTGQISFSDDGNTMYFTRCLLEGDALDACKIFSAVDKGGSWGDVKQLAFNAENTEFTCKHPTVVNVSGTETLYFASDKDGGKGGWDIWYSEKQSDGTFGTPLPVEEVNSVGDEETPFFHKEDKMLYFSSNGHPGRGGYDIFYSTYKNDKWDGITNLGPVFNSRVDEFYFSIGGDDPCYGYLVSNRPGTISLKSETCCDDIFEVKMPDRCPIVADVSTYDKLDRNALSGVTLKLIDTDSKEVVQELTNKTSNITNFDLERGKNYSIVATKGGYSEEVGTVSTVGMSEFGPVTKKVELYLEPGAMTVETYNRHTGTPLIGATVKLIDANGNVIDEKTNVKDNTFDFSVSKAKNYTVTGTRGEFRPESATFGPKELDTDNKYVLKLYLLPPLPIFDNIYYDFDMSNIREDAATTLDGIVGILKQYPDLVLEVGSHTDAKGSDQYNINLSTKRTKSAIAYLAGAGVAKDKLIPKWYGESMPAAPNTNEDGTDNPEGRQLNRRTVFKIISAGMLKEELNTEVESTSNSEQPDEKKK